MDSAKESKDLVPENVKDFRKEGRLTSSSVIASRKVWFKKKLQYWKLREDGPWPPWKRATSFCRCSSKFLHLDIQSGVSSMRYFDSNLPEGWQCRSNDHWNRWNAASSTQWRYCDLIDVLALNIHFQAFGSQPFHFYNAGFSEQSNIPQDFAKWDTLVHLCNLPQ